MRVPDSEPIWRALADPTRRAILDELRRGPRTTGTLAEAFPTTRFAVMKHLAVLVETGLVTVERRGRERLNHLNPVPLRQVYERWVSPHADAAAEIALRLADNAEASMNYGLDVRAVHTVKADGGRTWAALLELPAWWPPCWPDGGRLTFEPRVGGHLALTFEDGLRGSLWGVVAELDPGRELAVDGTMGMRGPVTGRWTMRLEPDGAVTTVTVEHRVLGEVDEEIRAGFTSGWDNTLARLDAYLSEGDA